MGNERNLGLFSAVIIGLSGAIGFEIFVLLNYAYFDLAGPSMISALLFCGIINLVTMFSYSELSAALPEVGGEYTYTKVAFGGFISFMAGCLRWLASVFGGALAAVVFVDQLGVLFSVFAPSIQDLVLVNASLLIIGLVVILIILTIRGVRRSHYLSSGRVLGNIHHLSCHERKLHSDATKHSSRSLRQRYSCLFCDRRLPFSDVCWHESSCGWGSTD